MSGPGSKARLAGAVLLPLIVTPALGTAPTTHGGRSAPPNVLLIQADDLGYGDLGAYGQGRFETPALDRLAREGIRFTQYYAGSTVCAPSRAALMTGLHTGHAWIRGNGDFPLRPEDMTVAEVLRQAGYRTAVIGKWGLGGPGTTGQPDRKGFEHAFGFLDHRHAHRQFTDHLWRNGERVGTDLDRDYVNDLFTKEAAAFIARDDPRPFFVYLNYAVPHAELRVPEDSLAQFRGRFPEQPFSNPPADAKRAGSTADSPSLGYRSQAAPHAAFAAMISRMDRDVGRLVDLLQERGIERRTLVIFTSDNGPHQEGGGDPAFFKSAGGLRGIKRDLYEGGIRVPMIARWPGTIPAGRVSDHVWAHWDVLPTLADLAGAAVPAGLDGMSMARALRGGAQPTHRFLYWEFHERGFQQAVRMGSWKAVRLERGGPLELYDLATDPSEQRDVAAAHPQVVAEIERYLATARTESMATARTAEAPAASWPARRTLNPRPRIEKAAASEGEWQSHFTTLTLHVAAADSVGESRDRTRPSTARGGRGATGRQPDADGAGPRGGRAKRGGPDATPHGEALELAPGARSPGASADPASTPDPHLQPSFVARSANSHGR